jgi:hypothetical protein
MDDGYVMDSPAPVDKSLPHTQKRSNILWTQSFFLKEALEYDSRYNTLVANIIQCHFIVEY